MDELPKALMTRYNSLDGATLRTKTPGGMWNITAPQASSGVYIVMTPMPAGIAWAQSPNAIKPGTQECFYQFTVSTLNGSAADITAAVNAFTALYDFCDLTMSTHRLLVSRRLKFHGPMRDDLTRGYVAYIEYVFEIGL